jgi:hypothetical protein
MQFRALQIQPEHVLLCESETRRVSLRNGCATMPRLLRGRSAWA